VVVVGAAVDALAQPETTSNIANPVARSAALGPTVTV